LSLRRILVTGGTGNIGSVLVKKLIQSGHSVRVLTLPGDPQVKRLNGTGAEIRYGDISKKEELEDICKDIEMVFHLAAVIISSDERVFDNVNITGTINLLNEAQKSGVEHFVHVSSASVVYPKVTPYSLSKRIAEREVRQSVVPWTIVRPALLYGPDGGLEFDMFLDYLKDFPVIPFIGNGKALKRPVYVDDLIDGFLKLAKIGKGTQKIYNFSGASTISMIDFARFYLSLMEMEDKKIVKLPEWLCILAANMMKKVMKNPPLTWNVIAGVVQDADLSPVQAQKDLEYNPSRIEKKLPGCFPRS